MISHKYKCIFIHIQKTGGSSIKQAIRGPEGRDRHRHRTGAELKRIYGHRCWRKYFKFVFVRNPWDRLVSWWTMIDGKYRPKYESGMKLNNFMTYIVTNASSFEEFLYCQEMIYDGTGRRAVGMNQSDYIPADVDFMGKFENLHLDFAIVAQRIGLDATLPHIKTSQHAHYRDFYTEKTAALVADLYKQDIERFKYTF